MKRIILYLLLLLSFASRAQKIKPYYGPFPYPAPNKHMMFYLQRSIDRNTIIYELNYEAGGDLNKNKPLRIYWIDFEDGAKISPLTFAQSKFAYGIESELIDESKGVYQLHLVSYKKIKLYLKRSGKNSQYQTHVSIKGKPAILTKIFVNIIGGTNLKPVVSHIELEGTELHSGQIIKEEIRP